MLHLANAELRVDLLDPTAERHLLGPRFCAGGFVWQVADLQIGPLLTGPEWPKADPSPFNGQGVPESFRHRTRDGRPLTWSGDRGISIGAGELKAQPDGEVIVAVPCVWTVTPEAERMAFHTQQQVSGFAYELTRTVTLTGRSLLSTSRLTNQATTPLMLEWFAHPFFALTDGEIRVEVPAGSRLADNPGFLLNGTQLTQKRRFLHHKDGHMDFLEVAKSKPPVFHLNHPLLRGVTFRPSFSPSECIIWGNDTTFSIEPYQLLILAPGESREWDVRYDFGVSSSTLSPTVSGREPSRL